MATQLGRIAIRIRPRCVFRHGFKSSFVKERTCTDSIVISSPHNRELHRTYYTALRFGTRSYADAPVSRPKAHTGDSTTKAKKPRKKSSGGVDGATTEKASKPKKRTAKKTSKAKTTKKPRKTKKAKAKPKTKKVVSEEVKQKRAEKKVKEQLRDLKKAALLKEPKGQPDTAWTLFNAEQQVKHKGQPLPEIVKQASVEYKNFRPEQLEHYNHIANQNKAKNNAAYRDFIKSFTPDEILKANNARRQLKRKFGKKGSAKYSLLKDERLVVRPKSAFLIFLLDRHSSGDFKGLSIGEAGKLSGREWKGLSDSEKKVYTDKAAADFERYRQECATVYKAK